MGDKDREEGKEWKVQVRCIWKEVVDMVDKWLSGFFFFKQKTAYEIHQ